MPKKMNLISKLYQETVISKIKETNWRKGSKGPLVVELDTTEVCDLACPGCISEDIVNNKNAFSNKRLLELGKEFHQLGVNAVILIGGGEPLAHPAVGDLISYLGENNIHIGLTTNGSFIDVYLDQIAKYVSWTRVSMDAGTNETYSKLRPAKNGKSKFDKVINNMHQLAKIKKGKLGYSFLIRTEADGFGIESNIHEIYTAAKLAKDIGCDYFEVKPSYQYAEGSDHFLLQHDPKRMLEAKKEIEKLSELVTDNFKIIKSVNLEYSLNGIQDTQPKDYKTCPVAELRTLVCPSGVYICPYFRGRIDKCIGDVKENSFSEMWNGLERTSVMKTLNPSKQCKMHCIRHNSNLELFDMIKKINSGEKIDTIKDFDRFI